MTIQKCNTRSGFITVSQMYKHTVNCRDATQFLPVIKYLSIHIKYQNKSKYGLSNLYWDTGHVTRLSLRWIRSRKLFPQHARTQPSPHSLWWTAPPNSSYAEVNAYDQHYPCLVCKIYKSLQFAVVVKIHFLHWWGFVCEPIHWNWFPQCLCFCRTVCWLFCHLSKKTLSQSGTH